jgi:hypothetical protein
MSLVTGPDEGDEPAGAAPRYGMLETVRQFALERLVAAGEAEAFGERHAAHFAALAEAAAPEMTRPATAEWLARLDRDYDNLRATLTWSLAHGAPNRAARIAWSLAWFWYVRGHLSEGRRWMEQILQDGNRLGPRETAQALAVFGMLIWAQGECREAETRLAEAETLGSAVGERSAEAFAHLVHAHANLALGDGPGALTHAAEAERLYHELAEPASIGVAMTVAAQVALFRGDLGDARTRLVAAETRMRAAGAPWPIALVLNLRSLVLLLAGDDAGTLTLLRESLALSHSLRDTAALPYTLVLLAGALTGLGRDLPAARLFGAAERLHERTGAHLTNPLNRQLHEQRLDTVRARLDPVAFAAAWEAGRALSLQETIAEAIGWSEA